MAVEARLTMSGVVVFLVSVLVTTQVYPDKNKNQLAKKGYNYADYGSSFKFLKGYKQEIETKNSNRRKRKIKGAQNKKQSRRKSKGQDGLSHSKTGRKKRNQDARSNNKLKKRQKNNKKKKKRLKNRKNKKGRCKNNKQRGKRRLAGLEFETAAEDLYEQYKSFDPSKFAKDYVRSYYIY